MARLTSNELGIIEDLMEKYDIPDIAYLEKCIIDHDKYGELSETLLCDPIIVIKALLQGICFKDDKGNFTRRGVTLSSRNYDNDILLYTYDNEYIFRLSNYKKHWWLAEEIKNLEDK